MKDIFPPLLLNAWHVGRGCFFAIISRRRKLASKQLSVIMTSGHTVVSRRSLVTASQVACSLRAHPLRQSVPESILYRAPASSPSLKQASLSSPSPVLHLFISLCFPLCWTTISYFKFKLVRTLGAPSCIFEAPVALFISPTYIFLFRYACYARMNLTLILFVHDVVEKP